MKPAEPDTGSPPPAAPATRLGVLLFSDIVGSTDLKRPERLGGSAYQHLLERHNALFENGIAEVPGARVIKHRGDGYFAEFPTASAAVRFALLFQSRMGLQQWGEVPLETRVGIYVGEYQVTAQAGQTDIVGRTADLAARLMSLAVGCQVLLTRQAFDDARQYVSAIAGLPKVVWLAHGTYQPKGGDPIEVCEVGFEGVSPLRAPRSSEKVRRVVPEGEEEMFGLGYPRPAAGLAIPGHPDWLLTEKLGEGGFGEVWLAENRRLSERHVFKFCFNAKRLRSLQREFTLFRLLKGALGDRDDIARLHDYRLPVDGREVGPPYYLESEYAPGGSLDQWARALPGGLAGLPEADKLELVAKVANAVAAAHSVGVRHKDIKPANILLRHAPSKGPIHPILADFGIGFLADDTELERLNITMAGFDGRTEVHDSGSSRTGTRLYAPPELLEGQVFTTHADVYALGVLLYQLAIGGLDKPFTPEWRDDVADEALAEVIAAATTRQATQRPAAAAFAALVRAIPARRAALAAEVERCAAEARRLADERAEAARRAHVARRRRLVTAGAAAALAVAAIITTLTLSQNAKLRAANSEVARQKDEATRQRDEATRQRDEANRQRMEAMTQQRRAVAAGKFVVSALKTADPDAAGKQSFKVLDAMKQAIANLDAGFLKGDPDIEAYLRITLGDILEGNGNSALALVQIQRAIDLLEKAQPPDERSLANARVFAAGSLRNLGRGDEAAREARAAFELTQRAFPGDNVQLAHAYGHVASAEYGAHNYEQALAAAKQALELKRKFSPDDAHAIEAYLDKIGVIYFAMGKPEEGLPYLAEAMKLARKLYTGDHRRLAFAFDNMGASLQELDRHEEALVHLREGLDMRRRLYEGDHPDIALSLNNYAAALSSLGRHQEALDAVSEATELLRRIHGPDHPLIAYGLNNAGAYLYELERFQDAIIRLREATEIWRRISLPEDGKYAHSHSLLANSLRRLGRHAEALVEFNKQLELLERQGLGKSEKAANSRANAGVCLVHLQRYDEAVDMLRAAIGLYQSNKNVQGQINAMNTLGITLYRLKRGDEALASIGEAVKLARAALPATDPLRMNLEETHKDMSAAHARAATRSATRASTQTSGPAGPAASSRPGQ